MVAVTKRRPSRSSESDCGPLREMSSRLQALSIDLRRILVDVCSTKSLPGAAPLATSPMTPDGP